MRFSIGQALLFAPKHFTELAIFGKRGIDARSRLLLWDAFKRKGLRDQQLKDAMLKTLPLNFGEKFGVIAGIVTILLGSAFIRFASDWLREFALQIHRVTDGPLDYTLLALQWWAFYMAVSLVGSAIVSIVAFQVYASRIAEHV